MRRIRTRMFAQLVAVQLIALLLAALIVGLVITNRISIDVYMNQREVGQLLLALDRSCELDGQSSLEAINENSSCVLSLAEIPERMTPEEQVQLAAGEIVPVGRGTKMKSYFMLDGKLMSLELSEQADVFKLYIMREFLGTALGIAASMMAMAALLWWISKPLKELSKATLRIAAGEFDVRVPERGRPDSLLEIDQLMHNFNRMADDLSSVEYLRRDFTSSVSHEFKTPLASISGYARLLTAENVSDEERREYAATISEECRRLSSLSENLLRITRLESRQLQPTLAAYALDEQLRRVLTVVMPEMERRGLELDLHLQPAVVCADRELMEQVWMNLLSNAMKFTPAGGRISVSITETEESVCATISDTGIGMTEEQQKRIYEKFYQADRSHRTEGSGLGLPLVRRIVDICGGKVEVHSAPERGSRFSVYLPGMKKSTDNA